MTGGEGPVEDIAAEIRAVIYPCGRSFTRDEMIANLERLLARMESFHGYQPQVRNAPLIRREPMSDSSSVDRWHPSNVEWPDDDRNVGPKTVEHLARHGERDTEVVPLVAYEALYADRGRVLAAARELARFADWCLNGDIDKAEFAPEELDASTRAALTSFREVDHG